MGPTEILQRLPFAVLDGGLSTALEEAGHDLRDELWTARLLVDAPAAVTAAHRAFVAAGAEVLITASYQASVAGLVRAGCTSTQARAAIVATTALARSADPTGTVVVAASVGPYGAVLGDGSEYSGRYDATSAELERFHRERLALLADGGPDLLAIETMPSGDEVAIVLDALGAHPGLRAWVSVTGGDSERTWAGDDLAAVAALASSHEQVVAIGVNCVAPGLVAPMLERIGAVTDRPLLAYPNHGRAWDGVHHCWTGDPGPGATELGDLVRSWQRLGARLIGGCCGYGTDTVRSVAAIRDGLE